MSWFGKLAGGTIGLMLGGPLGALIGATIGHSLDSSMSRSRSSYGDDGSDTGRLDHQQRRQAAFFSAIFPALGYMAKIDGQVTSDEIRLASALMDQMELNPQQQQFAQQLFNSGKQRDFQLDQILQQFYRECGRGRDLPRMFVELLIQSARIDGRYHPDEQELISHVCRTFRISAREQAEIETFVAASDRNQARGGSSAATMSMEDAYGILGVTPGHSQAEIKKAYRRMLSRHHPDKIISKGLPEEAIRIANHKTHEIKKAWECLRDAKG